MPFFGSRWLRRCSSLAHFNAWRMLTLATTLLLVGGEILRELFQEAPRFSELYLSLRMSKSGSCLPFFSSTRATTARRLFIVGRHRGGRQLATVETAPAMPPTAPRPHAESAPPRRCHHRFPLPLPVAAATAVPPPLRHGAAAWRRRRRRERIIGGLWPAEIDGGGRRRPAEAAEASTATPTIALSAAARGVVNPWQPRTQPHRYPMLRGGSAGVNIGRISK